VPDSGWWIEYPSRIAWTLAVVQLLHTAVDVVLEMICDGAALGCAQWLIFSHFLAIPCSTKSAARGPVVPINKWTPALLRLGKRANTAKNLLFPPDRLPMRDFELKFC